MNTEMHFHVIKDPVHGTMQFTDAENAWIKPFIDSPNFQRLRHIKQLGMGDYIFPGAVHTRFNHCLGCCYIASQIARQVGLAEEERQLVMIACLLHDIGHGPFSHAFEDIFHHKAIRHEDWTPFFLAEYRNKQFFSHYNHINPRHTLTEEKFQLIEAMIMHRMPEKHVLADIVSSQLDADRLDYLLRDSHFCGVSYGQFDLNWMLNSMAIIPTDGGERLGLTHKGIGVVEHYLMARRLMTRNIYHNPKKLALEFYLVKLLAIVAESISDFAPFQVIKDTRLGQFLLNVNHFNQLAATTANLDDLKTAFLKENFANYQTLCDYDIFSLIRVLAELKNTHPATVLAQRIQLRQLPKIVRLDNVESKALQAAIQHMKEQQTYKGYDWQLALIKTPHRAYNVEEDPILICDNQGVINPLDEISLMINAIGDKFEHTSFLCIDKAVYNQPEIQQLLTHLKTLAITSITH